MARTKDEKLHNQRRKQILEAARKGFIQNGFHKTSMRHILDTAGISSGGAYNYFASKADIVKSFVADEGKEIDLLLERMNQHKNPLKAIIGLVSDVIIYTSAESAILSAEIYAEVCRNDEIRALENENIERLSTALDNALIQGKQQGLINQSIDNEQYIEFILSLFTGYIARLASHPNLKTKQAAATATAAIVTFLGTTK